jgi:hypothetical protein
LHGGNSTIVVSKIAINGFDPTSLRKLHRIDAGNVQDHYYSGKSAFSLLNAGRSAGRAVKAQAERALAAREIYNRAIRPDAGYCDG